MTTYVFSITYILRSRVFDRYPIHLVVRLRIIVPMYCFPFMPSWLNL